MASIFQKGCWKIQGSSEKCDKSGSEGLRALLQKTVKRQLDQSKCTLMGRKYMVVSSLLR